MARAYKELPPIWHVETRLKLSDRYPSGLEWVHSTGWHKEGEMAGKLSMPGNYYLVRMDGDQYHAHRLVYYLRTGVDPGDHDVIYPKTNPERDNRKDLVLFERKTPKQPKRPYGPRRKRYEDG
jgi:hypothetical protein